MLKFSKVLFVGPKPPPVSGYSNVVNELFKQIVGVGVDAKYIVTVPVGLSKFYPGKLWVFLRLLYLVLLGPYFLVSMPFARVVYININGGIAQIFDGFVISLARLFRCKLILHHNSFSYIRTHNRLSGFLFSVAGGGCHHIVNCSCMGKDIKRNYSCVSKVVAFSNAAILSSNKITKSLAESEDSIAQANTAIRVGFMGYFDAEKGVDTFSEIIRVAKVNGIDIKAKAVGPVRDSTLMESVYHQYKGLIEFDGPKYGFEKSEFFESLDILLFPSRYKTEAEPLVVHDALEAGIIVFSTDVGCLKDVLSHFSICESFSEKTYVDSTVERLNYFSQLSLAERASCRLSLKNEYVNFTVREKAVLEAVLDDLRSVL